MIDITTSNLSNQLDSMFQYHYITTSNQNLDDYVSGGIYKFSSIDTSNSPGNAMNGWLVVYGEGEYNAVKQLFYRWGTTNANDYLSYVRTYNISQAMWSDWRQFAIA